ncbi:MAG: thiol:disulfide interchange protein DsbA/DsbL [Burkholderiaceae bacterium]
MKKTMIHWLGASLIGAFFVCAPITDLHAQSAAATADEWQPDADVLTLRQAGKVEANAPLNTVEVVEFFSYTCPHCAHFAPKLTAWRTQQPGNVRLIYLPVSWRADMLAPQRLYFTLAQLNRLDLHEQVFADWNNDPNSLATDAAVLNWALRQGFDQKIWQRTYNSAATSRQVRAAQQAFRRFELQGVPSVVINGRYALIPSEQLFDTLNHLVKHEQQRTNARP